MDTNIGLYKIPCIARYLLLDNFNASGVYSNLYSVIRKTNKV